MALRLPPLGHRDMDPARLETMGAAGLDKKLQEVSRHSLGRGDSTRRVRNSEQRGHSSQGQCSAPETKAKMTLGRNEA